MRRSHRSTAAPHARTQHRARASVPALLSIGRILTRSRAPPARCSHRRPRRASDPRAYAPPRRANARGRFHAHPRTDAPRASQRACRHAPCIARRIRSRHRAAPTAPPHPLDHRTVHSSTPRAGVPKRHTATRAHPRHARRPTSTRPRAASHADAANAAPPTHAPAPHARLAHLRGTRAPYRLLASPIDRHAASAATSPARGRPTHGPRPPPAADQALVPP